MGLWAILIADVRAGRRSRLRFAGARSHHEATVVELNPLRRFIDDAPIPTPRTRTTSGIPGSSVPPAWQMAAARATVVSNAVRRERDAGPGRAGRPDSTVVEVTAIHRGPDNDERPALER